MSRYEINDQSKVHRWIKYVQCDKCKMNFTEPVSCPCGGHEFTEYDLILYTPLMAELNKKSDEKTISPHVWTNKELELYQKRRNSIKRDEVDFKNI